MRMWAMLAAAAAALMGCGGGDFQAPLFQDQDAAGDAANLNETGMQSDAPPDAETGAEPDAKVDPEAGEDAAPEAGPDVCVPGTCETLGKNCGPTPDGCGGTLACGTCPTNQLCGGGGTPNLCGGCVPDTCEAHGYKCGTMPDGCGNTITCGVSPTMGTNSSCADSGLPPNFWFCAAVTSATPALPPPFASCKTYYNGYCCEEDHP